MITYGAAQTPYGGAGLAALKYVLIPLHGLGIAEATVARMLDPQGTGEARLLSQGEVVPYGARPVLLAQTTVYGAMCVEHMIRNWTTDLPRPWLVLISDAPVPPVTDARYRVRALGSRLAGVARVPYLPVLRTVEGAEQALQYKDVRAAGTKLRHRMEGK